MKLLQAIRNNPRNVKFSDFCAALEVAGFELDRQHGSHKVYRNLKFMETLVVQSRHDGHAKPYQIRQFLALLDHHGLPVEE